MVEVVSEDTSVTQFAVKRGRERELGRSEEIYLQVSSFSKNSTVGGRWICVHNGAAELML